MGPVTLGRLAGIFNLFWRKTQGDLLLLEQGTPHRRSHKLLLRRGLGGAHTPQVRRPAVRLDSCRRRWHTAQFLFCKGSWRLGAGCQGCGCWGKRHGQLLGSEERLAREARRVPGGSEGRPLAGNAKDVPGRGSRGWSVARARVAPAARWGPCLPCRFPRQLQLLQD